MEDHALFAESLAIALGMEGHDVRRIPLPENVGADDIKASFRDGVLELQDEGSRILQASGVSTVGWGGITLGYDWARMGNTEANDELAVEWRDGSLGGDAWSLLALFTLVAQSDALVVIQEWPPSFAPVILDAGYYLPPREPDWIPKPLHDRIAAYLTQYGNVGPLTIAHLFEATVLAALTHSRETHIAESHRSDHSIRA